MIPPRVCPPPEPDCPLYDQRLAAVGLAGRLRQAVLLDLRAGRPTLRDLIRTESGQVAQRDNPPLLLPAPKPTPPLPINHVMEGETHE